MGQGEGKPPGPAGPGTAPPRESGPAVTAGGFANDQEIISMILSTSGQALYETDVRTERISWSDGFRGVFGCEPGRIGSKVGDFVSRIHPEDAPGRLQSMATGCRPRRADAGGSHP